MSENLANLETSSTFEARIRYLLTPTEFERVMTAYVFSKYGHKGQQRDTGSRYFDHPRAVAIIIADELKIFNDAIFILALLHDIREDAYLLSRHRVLINFGREVMVGINLLTKDPKGTAGPPYLERLIAHASWKVLLVKVCDRLHNLRTLGGSSPQKQREQIAETRREYPAVLDRLDTILPRAKKEAGVYLRQQVEEACRAVEATWA